MLPATQRDRQAPGNSTVVRYISLPLLPAWPLPGHSLTLRRLDPDDAWAESELLLRSSTATRYLRLQGAGLPDARIAELLRIDPTRDHAIGLVETLSGTENWVGIARYARDGACADAALLVADAWQGRGLGKKLLGALVGEARREGIAMLGADILATNTPMLRIAFGLGMRIDPHPDGGWLRRATLRLAPGRGGTGADSPA